MRGKYYQKVLGIVSKEKYITWRKDPKNIKLLQNELCLQATVPHCMERETCLANGFLFFLFKSWAKTSGPKNQIWVLTRPIQAPQRPKYAVVLLIRNYSKYDKHAYG